MGLAAKNAIGYFFNLAKAARMKTLLYFDTALIVAALIEQTTGIMQYLNVYVMLETSFFQTSVVLHSQL